MTLTSIHALQGDCDPFMLHFMKSLAHRDGPSKQKGDDMRKTILKKFTKVDGAWSVEKYRHENNM